MWKKISGILLLSTTLVFGGLFSTTTDAAAKDNQQPVHINSNIYSVNHNFNNVSWDNLNDYFSQFLTKWQSKEEQPNHGQPEDKSNNKEEAEQPTERPKQEQPEKEQPEVQEPTEQAPQEEHQEQGQIEQLGEFEQQVVELTNAERTKNGLTPLKADQELSRVAREKSNNMAEVGYFDHNSPTYGSPFDMMQDYGINYRAAGENIAKGQRTPEEVVNAWMNSPGHRENILNGNFTHIGVGYVEQGNHWTQMFTGN